MAGAMVSFLDGSRQENADQGEFIEAVVKKFANK
jgi:hypothetical protein